jgi:hypothetical protein
LDDFATLAAQERRDIIAETAIGMGVDFTIVEKDFWVCWTLRALFSLPSEHPALVFKGGTSLSKAYSLIQRFSEDIDIVTAVDFYLDRGAADPETAPSRTQQLERMQELDAICADYIGGELNMMLRQQFEERLGADSGWELSVDSEDRFRHTLLFRYPTSAPDIEHTYIRGRVKLELGWRSATAPGETRSFRSYVAERFPDLMKQPDVSCTVLSPTRTFWEKITALHAESFRDQMPRFFSRHYFDVAEIFQTDLGQSASLDFAMLDTVREFKQHYYPAAWARYDLATPGSLTLIPHDTKLRALASDYRDMRMMFLRQPPTFEAILDRLRALESQINASRPKESS